MGKYGDPNWLNNDGVPLRNGNGKNGYASTACDNDNGKNGVRSTTDANKRRNNMTSQNDLDDKVDLLFSKQFRVPGSNKWKLPEIDTMFMQAKWEVSTETVYVVCVCVFTMTFKETFSVGVGSDSYFLYILYIIFSMYI